MTATWQRQLDAVIDRNFGEIVGLRRHLHMHPEPSGAELQTSLHLYQLFAGAGPPVRMGPEGCGVIVDSRSQASQRRIAVRADCDALRIQDEKPVEYHSQVPQVMHACGHDVHTAANGHSHHESVDPIAAAAELISTLYQFIPRVTDSQEAVVVSFGQIHGGLNANVIPEEVVLEGTVRTLNRSVRERTIAHIHRLADGIESVTGTQLAVDFDEGTASVDNDLAITALVERVARELLGESSVTQLQRPSMGSEDFAAYLEHAPGCMFRLGCAGDRSPWPGLHTPTFDVDEKCLPVGAKILARTIVELSKP